MELRDGKIVRLDGSPAQAADSCSSGRQSRRFGSVPPNNPQKPPPEFSPPSFVAKSSALKRLERDGNIREFAALESSS